MSNEFDDQRQCIDELRRWVETEAPFYGRNDESFLLLFLRGCKFSVDKAKNKLSMYYENRRRNPEWWTDRSIAALNHIIQMNVTLLLMENEASAGLPTVSFSRASKISEDSGTFDAHIKLHSVFMDLVLRRESSQLNGVVFIFDCQGCPLWVFAKFLNLSIVRNMFHGFLTATPLKVNSFHFINFPFVARAIWNLVKQLLSKKMRKRFHFYGSDWSALTDHVDIRLIPEEYGGLNGSFREHEMAFRKELQDYADYFLEDEKYGYQ